MTTDLKGKIRRHFSSNKINHHWTLIRCTQTFWLNQCKSAFILFVYISNYYSAKWSLDSGVLERNNSTSLHVNKKIYFVALDPLYLPKSLIFLWSYLNQKKLHVHWQKWSWGSLILTYYWCFQNWVWTIEVATSWDYFNNIWNGKNGLAVFCYPSSLPHDLSKTFANHVDISCKLANLVIVITSK